MFTLLFFEINCDHQVFKNYIILRLEKFQFKYI